MIINERQAEEIYNEIAYRLNFWNTKFDLDEQGKKLAAVLTREVACGFAWTDKHFNKQLFYTKAGLTKDGERI